MGAYLDQAGPQHAYRSGTILDGRYCLLRLLDEGGMSWVWLARHLPLDKLVAVKIGKPESQDPTGAATQEARVAATFHHPAIVVVHDAGCTPSGDAFVVMEYLEGHSLADALCRDGHLTPQAAICLLLPILEALTLCHERGFLHGDVKPSNIFLARERGKTQPKLLDFGVARSVSAASSSAELTGTPGYMAPEQVAQTGVDERADIWAICAVLYEAIAGRPAVSANNCSALLARTLGAEIEPLYDGDGRESSLWPILARGLRSAPAARYASAAALAHALANWLREQTEPRPAPLRPFPVPLESRSSELAGVPRPASLSSRAPRSADTQRLPARARAGRLGAPLMAALMLAIAVLVGTGLSHAREQLSLASSKARLAAAFAGLELAAPPRASAQLAAPSALGEISANLP